MSESSSSTDEVAQVVENVMDILDGIMDKNEKHGNKNQKKRKRDSDKKDEKIKKELAKNILAAVNDFELSHRGIHKPAEECYAALKRNLVKIIKKT